MGQWKVLTVQRFSVLSCFSANIIQKHFCSTPRTEENTKSLSCVCVRRLLVERRKSVFPVLIHNPVKQSPFVSTDQLPIINAFLKFCNAVFLMA